MADFSVDILQARREWKFVFTVQKKKNLLTWLLYPGKASFETDGEINSFKDKQRLREFSTTKPALQQILKGPTAKNIVNSEKLKASPLRSGTRQRAHS